MSAAAPLSISVVMPAFRQSDTVSASANSVLSQLGVEDELIIVDDGTNDAASAFVTAATSRMVRLVVQQPNRGPGASRNAGVAASAGELVAFLDGDDEALPGWLDGFRTAFGDETVGVARCGALIAEGAIERRVSPVSGKAADYPYGTPLAGTWAVRRILFDMVGGYDEALRYSENTELLIRLLGGARQSGLRVAVSHDARARIVRRAGRAYSSAPAEAAARCLDLHPEIFRQDRRLRADYLAIIANADRLEGRTMRAARRYAQAAAARPTPRSILRIAYPLLTAIGSARQRRAEAMNG